MKFESYFYYVKNDSKKEPIDKVVASCKEHAVTYFAGRKKMEEEILNLLNQNHFNLYVYVRSKLLL